MAQGLNSADIDAIWAEKQKAKKEKRRRRVDEKSKLLINSLMDAFTIILSISFLDYVIAFWGKFCKEYWGDNMSV